MSQFIEWIDTTIGEQCKVIAGQSPQGKFYNDSGTGLSFYQGKKEFGEKFIGTPKKWTSHTTKEAQAGDILMSVRAPVGPINFSTQKICIGRVLAAIRAGCEIDKEFLFYALLSKQGEISGNEGAVFASINKQQIESIRLAFPPLPEQKRIVAILDEAFAGINQAVANAKKNLVNARELFESYLNNVFTQKGEGWVDALIGESIKFIDYRGRTPKKINTGMRLITAKNVKMGFLQLEPQEYVDPKIYNAWMTRGIPKKGDVLFTTEAPLGNVAQLDSDEKVVFAQRVIIMQPNHNVLKPTFLKYMLLSKMMQSRLHEQATGATAKGIKASLLKKIPISFPQDTTTQESVVYGLKTLETETQHLETIYQQKLTALTQSGRVSR